MYIIETKQNKYIFDNSTGYIIPYSENLEHLIKNNHSPHLGKISSESLDLFKKYVDIGLFQEIISPRSTNHISTESLEEMVLSNPVDSILYLIVSQECNLRCEYCIYSDKYAETTTYRNQTMSFEVAKASIDLLVAQQNKKKKRGVLSNPIITFYGGEPLLNFSIVKKAVEYAEKVLPRVKFNITTNGLLLDKDICKFIIKHNILLAVSLDGDKKNNDRNRVTANQKPSFEIVYNNLKQYRQIEKEEHKEIVICCCIDQYTDLHSIVMFFDKNYEEIGPYTIMYSVVDQYDTTYYAYCDERYKDSRLFPKRDLYSDSIELYNELKASPNNLKKRAINSGLFSERELFLTRIKGKPRELLNNCCMPGYKLAILPNGEITLCEKMCNSIKTGNVFDGFDWEKTADLANQFINIMKKCTTCPIRRLCNICFAYVNNDMTDVKENYCRDQIRSKTKLLQDYCAELEGNIENLF